MDLDLIEELIRMVDESTVTELEIQERDLTIRISKAHAVAGGDQPVVSAEARQSSVQKSLQRTYDPKKLFRSPMVGSFYRSSSKEEAPFVTEGQKVKKGQPLCVIEAMKMLNMIESDRDGVIEKIIAEAGQSVEFGQPLFTIGD